jgi:hypothetical protein
MTGQTVCALLQHSNLEHLENLFSFNLTSQVWIL